MSKETAVEWLHFEYIKIFGELNPSTGKLYEIAYALEQAKQMEKEQIVESHHDGYNDGYLKNNASSAKYYYENYK
jgi:hypothetical protein